MSYDLCDPLLVLQHSIALYNCHEFTSRNQALD
jgi:hypothetical protein